MNHPFRQRKLALLLAALLLLSNALLTAHAFGEADHAAQGDCELLHQFERQSHAPPGVHMLPVDARQHPAPTAVVVIAPEQGGTHHFRSRAPPRAV